MVISMGTMRPSRMYWLMRSPYSEPSRLRSSRKRSPAFHLIINHGGNMSSRIGIDAKNVDRSKLRTQPRSVADRPAPRMPQRTRKMAEIIVTNEVRALRALSGSRSCSQPIQPTRGQGCFRRSTISTLTAQHKDHQRVLAELALALCAVGLCGCAVRRMQCVGPASFGAPSPPAGKDPGETHSVADIAC